MWTSCARPVGRAGGFASRKNPTTRKARKRYSPRRKPWESRCATVQPRNGAKDCSAGALRVGNRLEPFSPRFEGLHLTASRISHGLRRGVKSYALSGLWQAKPASPTNAPYLDSSRIIVGSGVRRVSPVIIQRSEIPSVRSNSSLLGVLPCSTTTNHPRIECLCECRHVGQPRTFRPQSHPESWTFVRSALKSRTPVPSPAPQARGFAG